MHYTKRIGALRNFRQAEAREMNFVEPAQQFSKRIFGQVKIAHVHRENPVFDQIEIVIEPFAVEIGLILVPANADILSIRNVHDHFDVGHERSGGAMHFEADDLPIALGKFTQLAQ
jgi:hypothetical protein